MSKVLMTIHAPGEKPTLESIKQRYRLAEDDIDSQFGVIATNPEEHRYTVLVEERAAGKLHSGENWHVEGPYSQPVVEPFGPPRA